MRLEAGPCHKVSVHLLPRTRSNKVVGNSCVWVWPAIGRFVFALFVGRLAEGSWKDAPAGSRPVEAISGSGGKEGSRRFLKEASCEDACSLGGLLGNVSGPTGRIQNESPAHAASFWRARLRTLAPLVQHQVGQWLCTHLCASLRYRSYMDTTHIYDYTSSLGPMCPGVFKNIVLRGVHRFPWEARALGKSYSTFAKPVLISFGRTPTSFETRLP